MRDTRLGLILSFLYLAIPAGAWSPATEEAIARTAFRISPPHLVKLAEIHEGAFEQGMRDAARHEQERLAVHLGADRGALERLLRREIDQAVQIMRERRPIEEFVYQLGVVAHLTADLNHPIHVGSDERLDAKRIDYEQYLERRRARFPTVFYGIESPRTLDRVIRRARARSRTYEPLLRSEYFRGGASRWSRQFDDRSTAFAIASLSWSHSVSDLVNIYYEIWRQVGGDTGNASLLRPGLLKGGPN
ncbi:MAG: hypothetical protein R3338_08370 [Thermoanaerobaculia bacterium]|nr:hypothetical protein [Thermoanaerobaculia bacterium]